MNKKLLILGAGIYQAPLIRKAKEMGLYTIAASCPGPYPGLALADQAWLIDTTDTQGLLKRAEWEGIDGVCTSGTDVAIRSLGVLSDRLCLPGISQEAARILTDKYLMKQAFLQAGVSTPPSYQVFSLPEAFEAYEELTPPVIVKAVDSSGSRGVTRADTPAQLEEAYRRAALITRKDYVLVERFLCAHEIGVDGFVHEGCLKLLLPHDKFIHTTEEGATLPAGHHFPYHCSEEVSSEIRRQIQLAVNAVGMDDCALNADVLVTEDGGVYLLEMGGRAGATCIPELISLHLGIDYYEQMIRNALGLPVDFSGEHLSPAMARLLFSPKPGILTHVDYGFLEKLKGDGVLASLDYEPGASIPGVHDATDRIGQVILQTDSVCLLEHTLHEIYRRLKIDGITLEQLWNE